eukprot:9488516-Pyramimonas_sp.AAC.1
MIRRPSIPWLHPCGMPRCVAGGILRVVFSAYYLMFKPCTFTFHPLLLFTHVCPLLPSPPSSLLRRD